MNTSSLHRVTVPLKSERMSLDPLGPGHAEALRPLLDDPRVARTLSLDGKAPAPGAEPEALASAAEHWEQYGFGLWLLRDRETGELFGRGGMQRCVIDGTEEVEVCWAIVPERWGQGYASEVAAICLSFAFDELYLGSVVAFTLPDNLPSRKVMTKAGMSYERDFSHCGRAHVLYRRRDEPASA